MKKRMSGVLALLFAMMVAVTGCSGKKEAIDFTAEAVNVDGISIPLSEVNFYLRFQQAQLQGFYGTFFGSDYLNQDIMGTGIPYGVTIREATVDALKECYIVEANADDLGVALTEEEHAKIKAAVDEFMAENGEKVLEAMSADRETVTRVMELTTVQAKAYKDRSATIDTQVDEEAIRQRRMAYVMTSTVGTSAADGTVTELTADELAEKMDMMEAIAAEAKASGDLNAAAQAYELTATVINYGKDDISLNPAVYEAAEKLADGEVSAVIEDASGYYVLLMESVSDEDATAAAREEVLAEREAEAYDAWYAPLEEAADVTINDALIEQITFERIFAAGTEG